MVLLHKLSVGQKLVTLPKFQPNTFVKAMEDHKINLMCAAPPLSKNIVLLHHQPILCLSTAGHRSLLENSTRHDLLPYALTTSRLMQVVAILWLRGCGCGVAVLWYFENNSQVRLPRILVKRDLII